MQWVVMINDFGGIIATIIFVYIRNVRRTISHVVLNIVKVISTNWLQVKDKTIIKLFD